VLTTKKRKRKKKAKMANTEGGVTRGASRYSAAGLLLALAATICSPCFAQEKKSAKDYALIYGTVWNAENRAIAGVPVKIQRVGDKKAKWQQVSDRRGEFAQRVPPGENEYVVVADIKVPKGGTKPQTKVHVQNNERVDISLHLTQ
jgi:hypothetical protein